MNEVRYLPNDKGITDKYNSQYTTVQEHLQKNFKVNIESGWLLNDENNKVQRKRNCNKLLIRKKN